MGHRPAFFDYVGEYLALDEHIGGGAAVKVVTAYETGHMAYAAEKDAGVEALPSQGDAEAVVDFRNGGIANSHSIVTVYLTVAVDVAVLNVAGLHAAEGLDGPGINFFLAAEQAFRYESPLLVVGKEGRVLVSPHLTGLVVEHAAVAVESEVASGRERQPSAEKVVKLSRCVKTGVLHLANVDILSLAQTDYARHGLAGDEDAAAVVIEIVELQFEMVAPEVELDTDVPFESLLPHDTGVAYIACGNAGGVYRIGKAPVEATDSARIHGGDVAEAPAAAYLVVTDLAYGGLDLEQADGIFEWLPEVLVGDYPAHGPGRKEAEAVAGSEILAAVVTEVELGEIAVGVAVGCTAGDSQALVRECGPVTFRIQGGALAQVPKEHGSHSVLACECALVVGGCLYVENRLSVYGCA